MAFRSNVHGRLQLAREGKTLGAFTVNKDGYTYLILAEFVVNKWQVFWSAKSADEEESLALIGNLAANITNFFTDTPASENINEEAALLAAKF